MNSAAQTASLNLNKIVSGPHTDSLLAFEELHAIYSRRLYRTIVAITKNPEDAEDALQDTFLRAHLARETFEGRSSLYCWLTRIAINSALMILRKRRVRRELLVEEAIDEDTKPLQWEFADRRPNPEQYYIQYENHRRLQSAISRLPTTYRRVFEIRQRSDGSIREIAQEAGITVAATKTRLLRARRALHSSIGQEQSSESHEDPQQSKSKEEVEKEFFEHIRPSSLPKRFISEDRVAAVATDVANELSSATNDAALRVDGGVVRAIL